MLPSADPLGQETCSFCAKPLHLVVHYFTGLKATICDECVQLCHELLQAESAEGGQPEDPSPGGGVLA